MEASSAMQRLTAAAMLSFSGMLLFYEGFVYNVVFLGRVLPVLGKGDYVIVVPLAVVFNSLYMLAIWSFLKAHLTDPGKVPSRWQDFVRSAGETVPVFAPARQWQPGKVTFCKSCERTRPERAHHCQNCGFCVLRFDHHCLWIGNCVGFKNHKHFLLLGLYCCAGLFLALGSSLPELASCAEVLLLQPQLHGRTEDKGDAVPRLRTSDALALLVFGVLGSCVCVLLCALLLVHLPRAAHNVTAPETAYASDGSGTVTSPFDRGSILENLQQLFGAPPGICWLLPVSPHGQGDGLCFPHADDPPWLRRCMDGLPPSPGGSSSDDDGGARAEELWRLRYAIAAPELPKTVMPSCGSFFF